MRVPSLWYDGGHGSEFHAKDKPILVGFLKGELGFNAIKGMILRPEWLRVDKDEFISNSMKLSMVVRDEYIREMPKLLKKTKWINRLAIHRLADFLVILHRNDDMYFERFGYLMGRFIERYPEWKDKDKAGRYKILEEERSLYLGHEKRMDRIQWITMAWDHFLHMYEVDDGITASVDFIIERFYVHKDMYNKDEVSRLGIKAFYPENWYPVGRGMLWEMVHGGKG